jgi:hypothetical protein
MTSQEIVTAKKLRLKKKNQSGRFSDAGQGRVSLETSAERLASGAAANRVTWLCGHRVAPGSFSADLGLLGSIALAAEF